MMALLTPSIPILVFPFPITHCYFGPELVSGQGQSERGLDQSSELMAKLHYTFFHLSVWIMRSK